MTDCTEQLESALTSGLSLEAALGQLRSNGAHPTDVIKAIRQVKQISLGEAKVVFSQSTAWALEVSQGDKLHEELIAILSPKNSLK